jgi:hypothetical protein
MARRRLYMLTKKDHQTNEMQQLGRIPRFLKIRKYRRMVV